MAEEPHLSLEDANRIRVYIVSMIKGDLSRNYVKNTIKTLFNRDLDNDLKNTEQLLRIIYEKENSPKTVTQILREQEEGIKRCKICGTSLNREAGFDICYHCMAESLTNLAKSAATDRPVTCWFCGEKLYYAGDTRHEPEIKIAFEGYIENDDRFNNEYFIRNKYIHSKCFVELIALLDITSARKQVEKRKEKGPRMLRPEKEVKT